MAPASTLGGTTWGRCESVIRRFEGAWGDYGRPGIDSFIPPDLIHSPQLLVELVHVDLEFRLRDGEPVRAEDYLDRYPELAERRLLLDLLVTEFGLRNRHCPPAWPEEYWLRFPKLIADLRERLPDPGGTGWLHATRPERPAGPQLAGLPVITGYEIQGELGRGGMGVVYKARDLLLHRTVAVKTFATAPRLESCARFAREAEAIARLDHPNIVPVYEVGEWYAPGDGRVAVPYFAMKLYPGGSLDAAPAGPGTDAAGHARTVETIARAVHHAHQRGVLHRDLKPSNILLDEAGGPHVADFGLAGRVDPAATTITAVVAGTPAYMAPEQARSPKQVSTAADVYGLGAILYHQLTGRPPFAADTALATLDLVASTPPARPSSVNPTVPRDLDTICLKCLEKEPARRYASAAELADDLQRWREDVPITARPTSAWEHARRLARRYPLVAASAVTTLAALLAAVVVLAESNARIRAKEREAIEAYRRECEMRYMLEDTIAREQRGVYLDRVTLAGRFYEANQLPAAWEMLDQCAEPFRKWEWHYLDSLRRAGGVPLVGHATSVYRVGFLPDGRLVSADVHGSVRTWDTGTRKSDRAWKVFDLPIAALAVHPKKNWVAVAGDRGVAVWDADTGRAIARLPGASWVAFSPDGTRVVTADQSAVRLWAVPEAATCANGEHEVPAWEPAGELKGHEAPVLAGVFLPDGRQLITSSADRSIRTWDVETGTQVARRNVPVPVTGLALAAEGTVLAEAHFGAVLFTDPATGEVRDRLEYPTGDRPALASAPGRCAVAVSSTRGEILVWDAAQRRTTRVFRGHPGRVSGLAFGPGGQLASCGGDPTVRVWDVTREVGVRTLAWVGDGVGGVSVSPDGTRLAVGPRNKGYNGGAQSLVLDAETGRELHRVVGWPDVGFLPTSGRMVTRRPEGGLILWDPATGQELWNRPFAEAHDPGTAIPLIGRRLAISADGALVGVWARRAGGLQVWRADGSVVGVINTGPEMVNTIAFTADGTRLVVATTRGVTMWDIATKARLPWGEGLPGSTVVACSLTGQWVATVDTDRVIRLREVATGREVRHFVGTAQRVNVMCFSPDGTRLVTGGADRTVRVWDVETGRELLSLPGPTEAVTGLAWDAKNGRIYALDHAVRVWSTTADHPDAK